MNKAQLVSEVSKKTGLSKKDATNAVNATIEAINKECKKWGSISWLWNI